MLLYFLLSTLPVVWALYTARCLVVNYRRASQLGLPIVFVPVSPDNPIWIAIQTAFTSIFKYVPFDAVSFTRHCRLGWEFHDRYKTHQRLGDAYMLVTPDRNWLYVGEPEAVTDIFSRSKEFGRPVWMLAILNVFGPNVSTAEGPEWQRQRKLTATPFNESKSISIWSEALRQAHDMLTWWTSHESSELTSTSEDTRTLALHVLAYAGFQQSYPFKSTSKDTRLGQRLTYRDSISLILENIFAILVFPSRAFSLSFLPAKWKRIGQAITDFRAYMLDILAEEKRLLKEGRPGTGNLVSNLVRASENNPEAMKAGMKPLSIDEILGNIFVFNFAGHDTTAISLAFSMFLLVAHPKVQDWVAEELQHVLGDEHPTAWDYEAVFPRLKRSLAVLLETLRLYNPLPGVPKYTGYASKSLKVNGHEYVIPSNTLVVPSLQAVHTNPRDWGEDSLVWRPSRWIVSPLDAPNGQFLDLSTILDQEHLVIPRKGTYIPWSDGARNCPGKKFAQVEFLAVIATLFRNHRVSPVMKAGETKRQAEQRVLDVVQDSNVELLLQMRNPESVAVRWSRR